MDPAILFVIFKSASKIRLVRWPALLETRSSACQLHTPLARRWRAACERLANYTHPSFITSLQTKPIMGIYLGRDGVPPKFGVEVEY